MKYLMINFYLFSEFDRESDDFQTLADLNELCSDVLPKFKESADS